MSDKIKCKACGHLNEYSRVFCFECGQKLDYREVERRRIASFPGCALGLARLFRLALFLCLATIAGLLLWPVQPRGAVGEKTDAMRYRSKLLLLEQAAEGGPSLELTCTEAEINAYLAETVRAANDKTTPSWRQLQLDTVNVQLTPDRYSVVLVARMGPLAVSYEVRGVPRVGGEGFDPGLMYAAHGHLWVPPLVDEFLVLPRFRFLSLLTQERGVLDHVSVVELGSGKIKVKTGSKQ